MRFECIQGKATDNIAWLTEGPSVRSPCGVYQVWCGWRRTKTWVAVGGPDGGLWWSANGTRTHNPNRRERRKINFHKVWAQYQYAYEAGFVFKHAYTEGRAPKKLKPITWQVLIDVYNMEVCKQAAPGVIVTLEGGRRTSFFSHYTAPPQWISQFPATGRMSTLGFEKHFYLEHLLLQEEWKKAAPPMQLGEWAETSERFLVREGWLINESEWTFDVHLGLFKGTWPKSYEPEPMPTFDEPEPHTQPWRRDARVA